MRNLKKVLALVLALVMSMSLVTIANASDFTDSKDITYTEAVDVMSAIGVLNGLDTGAFNPKGTLTREQAAKIICTMLLGDNADKLGTSSSSFTDVAVTRWSSPYIEFCVSNGIIAGVGNNQFNPTGKLTGHAFAKMLLVALGYEADREGYVGTGWSIKVAEDAVTAGITLDGVAMSAELTREQAAQMAFQTLKADMVKYASAGSSVVLPDGTQIITGGSTASKIEGKKADDYRTVSADQDEYVQFCETHFADLKMTSNSDADFGFKGNKWVYGTGSDKDIGVYSSAKILASYTTASDVTFGDLYKLGDWTTDAITIQENGNNSSNTVKYGTSDGSSSLTWKGSKTKVDDFAGYDGAVLNVVDNNNDGTIDAILVVYGYLAEVTKVNKATASADRSVVLDVYDNATAQSITYETENYDKGDYVIVYPDAALADNNLSGSTELLKVEAAESVTGSCTAYTGSATNSYTAVTVDGTKYEVGATAKIKETVSVTEGEFTVYLLNGYAVAVMADDNYSADISGIVYVTAAETQGVNNEGDEVYYVKTVGMDGVYTVIQTKVDPSGLTPKSFYMMDKNSDGEYVFTAATAGKKLTDVITNIDNDANEYYAVDTLKDATSLKPDTKSILVDGDSGAKAYLTSETRYIFVDGTKSSVVTGGITKMAPDATKVLVSKDGSAYEIEAMIFEGSYSEVVSGDVLYVANNTKTGESAKGDTYDAYDMKGEKISIVLESAPAANTFYNYTVDGDGVYTLNAVGTATGGDDGAYKVSGTSVKVSEYKGTLTIGSVITDVDAANVLIVDLDGEKDVETVEDLTKATGFNGDVLIVDGEITIIFVTDMDKTV